MISSFKKQLKILSEKLPGKRLLKVLLGLFVAYLLLSYFAVNPIAKKLVPNIAEKSLASQASVGSVEFDPFRFKITVKDFLLANQNGELLTRFKKLVVDLELSGMFDLAWKFRQVSITEPHGRLALTENGQLNWDALLDKLNENPAPPSDTIPRLIIEHIIVNQGQLQYHDMNGATPINATLAPLSFELKGFSTLPKHRGDYLISAVFAENGGTLKWKGDMGVNPVASKGVVALEGINIAQALQLIKGLELPLTLKGGDVKTSFTYDFSLPKTIPTLALSNIAFNLSEATGELGQDETVSLDHAVVSVPQLIFTQDKVPTLQVKNIGAKLSGLHFSQQGEVQASLKESVASLPQLDFVMEESPQLSLAGLNVTLTDMHLNDGEQHALDVPKAEVNDVNFSLAENSLGIKEVALSNIRFSGGGTSSTQTEGQDVKTPMATLATLTIADSLVALESKRVSAQSILLSDFKTSVIRGADGSLNWLQVFDAQEGSPATAVDKNAPKAGGDDEAWAVALAKVALSNASIQVQDNSAPTPVKLDIVKANIEVQNASLDMTKPLPVKASFRVKQGGQFRTSGQLWPSPFKADLGLHLTKLSLKPFAPYVNQFAILKLKSGFADAAGKLRLKQKQDFALAFNGKFDVKQLALTEEADDAPFLSWDSLASDSLKFSLLPDKLHMAKLNIIRPSGKLIINQDRSMNVNRILRSSVASETVSTPDTAKAEVEQTPATNTNSLIKAAPPQANKVEPAKEKAAIETTSSTMTETFPVSVDVVRIKDGKLVFADLSLTPQFGTDIHSLNGVINSLSTTEAKVSQVEMDGKVDDYGSARIRGSLQPFNVEDFTDIQLAFTNLEMSRLTPYSGKFAGRYIDSGKLSVDLEYKIKQHQLAGENKFIINKLRLGKKVESADAADLPLDLAIAILEDGDGVIDLDLPISGSLDDPKFSYGGIFWKAFTSILTKIVTAPFRALGNLFGDGAEDFDGIAFEAGASTVSPPEMESLVKVSQALAKRQGLSLGVVPSYNSQLDTQAIKEATYRRQVAEEMDVKLAEGQRPGPVDLANEDVQDAVEALHDELTKKGLFKRMVSKFEKPEEGHYEKAQASLIASIEVTEADLNALAVARGSAIQAVLLSNGISEDRVTTMAAVEAKAKGDYIKTELTLDVSKSAGKASTPTAEPENTPSTEIANPA